MASSQLKDASDDFEVLPRNNTKEQDFLSINSATENGGDPYEKREDIKGSKLILHKLKERLNFESEEKIDELHEKLKSRKALDASIVDEVQNLQDIAGNEEWKDLQDTARRAKDLVSDVIKLAKDNNTTVKRASEVLDIALPAFILACDLSKGDAKLSGEFTELQDLYHQTQKEMIRYQQEFQMDKREEKLKEGKALLQRSISSATSERERISNELEKEETVGNMDKFQKDKNEVENIIDAEMQVLEEWLLNCSFDTSNIESTEAEQKVLHSGATKKYQARLQNIDISLEVNCGRQADLLKQLEELKKEEERLKKNRMFEMQVQQRASKLNTDVLNELATLKKKIDNIRNHASTAEEIMRAMRECSEILFDKALEIQKDKEENLKQLQMEALVRERSALSTAAVELKFQAHMGKQNIIEYESQIDEIRKEIGRAASKGQALTVSKKKQALTEYQEEVEKERKSIVENDENCMAVLVRLDKVDELLQKFGISSPSIDSMIEQRLAEAQLDISGPMSLVSM